MALPRVLNVDSNDTLKIVPLPELQSLRTYSQGEGSSFKSFSGEIVACISGTGSITVGTAKLPYLSVGYSSGNPQAISIDSKELSVPYTPDGCVSIHIFMDGSILEVFINKTAVHTKRVYELDHTSPVTTVSSLGEIDSLRVFDLNPVSRDRLTT